MSALLRSALIDVAVALAVACAAFAYGLRIGRRESLRSVGAVLRKAIGDMFWGGAR